MNMPAPRTKVGRPPQGEFSGKSATLTTRLTPETRSGLEREAKFANRSLSQEVELRLDRSLKNPKGLAERAFGNPRNRALAVLITNAITTIEAYTGHSWREDRYTFEAVAAAIPMLISHLSPKGAPAMPDRMKELYGDSPLFSRYENPAEVGISTVLGLVTSLDLHQTAPQSDHAENLSFADDFYLLPRVRQDLGL